jgi:hypothetical protein
MAAQSKPRASDFSRVIIAPKAYGHLNDFLDSLRQRIMERAAMQAQTRPTEKGWSRISVEDFVSAETALLPIVLAELEHSSKQESTNVRHAS